MEPRAIELNVAQYRLRIVHLDLTWILNKDLTRALISEFDWRNSERNMIAGLKFTFIHRTLSNTRQRRAAAASRVTGTPPSSDPSKSTAITVVRGIFPNNYRISVLKYSLD